MHATLAGDGAGANQLELSFVRQGGRLKSLAGVTAAQVSSGDAPQFRVDDGNQAAQRLFISSAPCGEQCRNVLRSVRGAVLQL